MGVLIYRFGVTDSVLRQFVTFGEKEGEQMQFSQKTVLITGGASGIGAGIVRMFLQEGAFVAIGDKSRDNLKALSEELQQEGFPVERCSFDEVDVANSRQIDAWVKETVSKTGTADVLVNGAGFGLIAPRIEDVTDEQWDLVLNVNLKGAFYTCRSVVPYMKRQRSGRIINIASLAGRTKSVIAGIHYTSAKTGLVGLTRHLAHELMDFHITVNTICPGTTDTPLVRKQKTPEELAEIASRFPMKRLARVEEIVKGVKYLADFDNGYVTGIALDINGGMFMN